MLDECAPGHKLKMMTHNMCIMYKGRTYFQFPLGGHGKARGGKRYDVQIGHVRQLANMFEIMKCAKLHIKQL